MADKKGGWVVALGGLAALAFLLRKPVGAQPGPPLVEVRSLTWN